MEKLVVVFDMGGTLREINLPDKPKRNYAALRKLYNLLVDCPECDVHIVTLVPGDRTQKQIFKNLEKLGLKRPKTLQVMFQSESKGDIFKRLKPDLVFEDEDRWLRMALDNNALALKIF